MPRAYGVAALMLLAAPPARAQVAVLTQRYDIQRTGLNLAETTLTQANVSPQTFGKVFSLPVDGQLYAQPLIVPQVVIPDAGTHDLVILATEHDSVYAYDAEDVNQTHALWQVNFGMSVPNAEVACNDLTPEVGITGTPVVDADAGWVFVIAKTEEAGVISNTIHALKLSSGADAVPPQIIAPSLVNDGGVTVAFTGQQHFNRPGLLLSNGVVYAGFGSHCDQGPYHGWIVGFDAHTLNETYVLNTTPNGSEGALWQAGGGLIADSQGAIYGGVGNGTFDWADGGPDLGESVVKWSPKLAVLDWFTPENAVNLSKSDSDLGSTPAVLWTSPPLLLSGDKGGTLRVLDPTNLGQQQTNDVGVLQAIQFGAGLFVGPILWQAPAGLMLYLWSSGGPLISFNYASGQFMPLGQSTVEAPSGKTGGVLTLSSNGATVGSGIVWASVPSASSNGTLVGGDLFALSAEDLTNELWSSTQRAGDAVGNFAKFAQPVVANGLVYVDTFSNALNVYGLLPGGTASTTGASTSGSGATSTSTSTSTSTATATSGTATGTSGASSGAASSAVATSGAGAGGEGTTSSTSTGRVSVTGTGCGCGSGGGSDLSLVALGLACGLRRRRSP